MNEGNKIENYYENIITEYVTMKLSTKYVIKLKELKYNVKLGDIFDVPIKLVSLCCNKKVLIKCPKCENEREITLNNYTTVMKKGHNYTCTKCNTFNSNMLRIYNVENSMNIDKFVNKILETKLEKYGDENYNNREKCKETCLEKYGVENYNNLEKYKETCLEKYGVDNVSKIDEIKKKKKATLKSNYNVDSMLSLKRVQDKKHETVLKKYGVDNVFQLDWVKEKSKITLSKKYGVDYLVTLPNKRYKIKYDDRFKLYYQGTYEKDFLDFCLDNNLKISKPKFINYEFNDKTYKYFPDFYYEPLNLLIEIKSDYIFELQKDKNIAKHNYSILNNYNHIFIINKNYYEFIKKLKLNV